MARHNFATSRLVVMPLVIDIVTAITDKVSKGSEQELATPILAVVNTQLGQVTQ